VQPLANLSERGKMLPHHYTFVARLRTAAAAFFEAIPQTLAPGEWDRYAQAVDAMRIDNFGSVGTRLLLSWSGVDDVSTEFRRRGSGEGGVPRFGRLTAEIRRGEGVAWMRTRVVSYVEYDV